MSLFAKLLGSTTVSAAPAPSPAPSPAPAPAASADAPAGAAAAPAGGELSETRIEAALQAARAEGVTEGTTAGATAERERTAAVFASDAGKSNMAMAAWMLSSSPAASADSIIKHLETMPAGAAAASAATTDKPVTTALKETPKADLGGGSNANAGAEDGTSTKADTEKLWDGAIAGLGPKGSSINGVTSGQRGAWN